MTLCSSSNFPPYMMLIIRSLPLRKCLSEYVVLHDVHNHSRKVRSFYSFQMQFLLQSDPSHVIVNLYTKVMTDCYCRPTAHRVPARCFSFFDFDIIFIICSVHLTHYNSCPSYRIKYVFLHKYVEIFFPYPMHPLVLYTELP